MGEVKEPPLLAFVASMAEAHRRGEWPVKAILGDDAALDLIAAVAACSDTEHERVERDTPAREDGYIGQLFGVDVWRAGADKPGDYREVVTRPMTDGEREREGMAAP